MAHQALIGLNFAKNLVSNVLFKDKFVALVRESGLFDETWYRLTAGAECSPQDDAVVHYLETGHRMGFNPNPYFDGAWYIETYRDVALTQLNPLVHYIRYGAAENRRPGPIFDAAAYAESLSGHGGDKTEGSEILLRQFLDQVKTHFHQARSYVDAEGVYQQELGGEPDEAPVVFDPVFYQAYYADTAKLSPDEALDHYRTTGLVQGRYGNVDVAIAALEKRYGALPTNFDEDAYLENYSSVGEVYPYRGGAIVHYLQFGRAEGLRANFKEPYDSHRLHLMLNRIYDLPDVVVDPNEKTRINVLVPAFEFKSMSAGFFGVFQVARFIARCGFNVRLVMFDNFYYNEAEFREKLKGYPDMVNLFDEVEVLYIGERKAPLRVSPDDNCVATVWYSAHFARKIMDEIGRRPFLYLIQDYETNFYAGGSSFCVADETYRFNFNALFSSQALQKSFVKNKIGRFASGEVKHTYFNNACARYLPDPETFLAHDSHMYKLAFYSRPVVNRNMFELGALALCEAYRRGIFARNRWEFYGVGLGEATIRIARNVELRQMKRMNLADYQVAIGQFDLGLCLMASPHPSLLPFDLGGSGALVVTNTFGVKNQAYFNKLCKNVIATEPNLDDLVNGIAAAIQRIDDRETRLNNALGMRYPDDWGQTFGPEHVRFIKEAFRLPDAPAAVVEHKLRAAVA